MPGSSVRGRATNYLPSPLVFGLWLVASNDVIGGFLIAARYGLESRDHILRTAPVSDSWQVFAFPVAMWNARGTRFAT